MIGTTILQYRIVDRLGSGGMGEVFLAEDTRLGRAVALKFLRPSSQSDADSRARLLQEARAASLLRSPHIAIVYEMGEHEDSLFIVMEHVEGQLLSQRIKSGPVPVAEALDVAMQVAEALSEAHAHGVVHRDIKSENLIVTDRGLVKVLDFGLAKFVESGGDHADSLAITMGQTMAGMVLGTVYYMSPEQALGRAVDHRTDIFSLGVVLFEMLAGGLPFRGDSATQVVDNILHGEPPLLEALAPVGAQAIEPILRKAMEKGVEFRYQDARSFHDDLRRVAIGLTSNGIGPGSHGFEAKVHWESSLGTGRDAPTRDVDETTDRQVAVMTFANITGEASDDWIGSGIAETVTADLRSVNGLTVIGRAQIFDAIRSLSASAGASLNDRDAVDIGRRVGASWIIGGGYQRLGDRVRITAQLVDARSGSLVKTVKLDGEIAAIFDLQDKIVFELVGGLDLKPGRGELAEITHDETQSVEAYESYSLGMMNLRVASRDSLDRAVYYFEKAIESDPEYVAAWAALGSAYGVKGAFLNFPELIEKALDCERKAIRMSPRFAAAYSWLAMAYLNLTRYDEAVEAAREALKLEPENATALATLGRAYWLGQGLLDEGIAALARAAEINPKAGYSFLQLGFLHAIRGNFAEAERACRQAISLQEHHSSGSEGLEILGAYSRLGYVFYRQGRYQEALEEYERGLSFLASSEHLLRERTLVEVHQKTGAAHLRLGHDEEAERHLDEALKRFEVRRSRGATDPFTAYYVATIWALKGDAERAGRFFGESLAGPRAFNLVRVALDPDFEAVRDLPAFRAFVETPAPSSVDAVVPLASPDRSLADS